MLRALHRLTRRELRWMQSYSVSMVTLASRYMNQVLPSQAQSVTIKCSTCGGLTRTAFGAFLLKVVTFTATKEVQEENSRCLVLALSSGRKLIPDFATCGRSILLRYHCPSRSLGSLELHVYRLSDSQQARMSGFKRTPPAHINSLGRLLSHVASCMIFSRIRSKYMGSPCDLTI
jgi:hypothetical protein